MVKTVRSTATKVDSQDWVSLLIDESDPDERLHNLVRDAAKLFKAPIAMINLLTSETVIFKACIGQTAGERLERAGSFCDLAASQEPVLHIVDAPQDPRFKEYMLVTNELKIRSYFGKALHAPDGSRIGTLCVLDQEPHEYGHNEQAVLAHLAEAAERELQAILRSVRLPHSTESKAMLA